MKVTFTTQGLADLDKALAELPKRTARAALQRAAVKALEPMADAARRNAPVQFGDLRGSITVSTQKPHGYEDAGKAAFAGTLAAGGTRQQARAALIEANQGSAAPFAQAFMGPGRHPQAMQQEFGNVNHTPHAYMRPAYDAEAQKAFDSMAEFMATEIEKATQRHAKRQAKRK